MSEKIVQLNEEVIKGQLKELVRGSVEETLNELLEAEAEKLTQAARYERKEKFKAVYETLATCTPIQRERFLLYALDGLSFAEIARQQGCSKYAVRDSVEAVRKKLQKLLMDYPHESPLSGY